MMSVLRRKHKSGREGTVKNCEGSENILNLQANKLSWNSFMDASRTQDSWVKDKELYYSQQAVARVSDCTISSRLNYHRG